LHLSRLKRIKVQFNFQTPTKLFIHFAAHEAGIVSMQVSCDSEVVSDTVIFEYKNKEEKPDEDDDGSFIWVVCHLSFYIFVPKF